MRGKSSKPKVVTPKPAPASQKEPELTDEDLKKVSGGTTHGTGGGAGAG